MPIDEELQHDIVVISNRCRKPRPTLWVARANLRAEFDEQIDHPYQATKTGSSERVAAEKAFRYFGVGICAGREDDAEGFIVVAVDCVQDRSAAADIHRVERGAAVYQEPHVRELSQGSCPVKCGATHGVRDTNGVRIVVKLVLEQLEGSAKDNIVD